MNETQNAIVEAHGVSPIEFDILDAVRLHGQLARTHVARYAVFLGSANPEESFSQAEYELTVETCLQKGWIKVLTSEDCAQDRLRWQNEQDQFCGEIEYRPDDVDFTEAGARLFFSMFAEIDAAQGKRPYHSLGIGFAWSMPGCVHLFGAYADQVMQHADDVLAGREFLGDGCRQIERVEGPFPTGPWWINRFVRLQEGYRCDVYCADVADGDEAPSS